ncbi:MAG: hypothetical protein QHC67_13835 [Sphingobium sp.]|uniref:hypothetical protein n=1 Tax=Sphingobium sp. TaxID=1912891 RepID=UPI0029BAC1C9|nr:hypothetical protein [Sphingobium sp.]MDX3910880.1 hypothetical protein [Sphingobium sp.]
MTGSSRLAQPDRWPLLPSVAAFAFLLCLAMLCISWHAITSFGFHDPDDALRYVEVRDFLGGQSWFDVSQHRINPPVGGPMHWSRLVDLPIAALMLLLRPLFGVATADRITLTAVPMLLTWALCIMFALAVRRLGGTLTAITATILISLSIPILIQFQPMRIDHHGWQILMAAIALWGLYDSDMRRGGIVAGLAVAFWMHVSSEGLPYAALFGGVIAVAFIRDKQVWAKLSLYAGALATGSAALLLVTRGWPEAALPYCDAISPVYLFPMLAVALSLPVAHRFLGTNNWTRRAIIPFVAGAVGAALYILIGGKCRAGPFGTLDPIVYKYWYLNVSEGRPVWEQSPLMAAIIIVPPLVGALGMLMALKAARDPEHRFRWFQMLLLSGGAYAVSLLVMRAVSTSYLMALPGVAIIILILLPKAQGLATAPARIFATACLCGLTPIGISAIAAALLPAETDSSLSPKTSSSTAASEQLCAAKEKLSGFAALPKGTVMAPLDIGPAILAFTLHSVIGTAHHRNSAGMRDVILSFMGSAEQARTLMKRHGISYVAFCPHRNEVETYTELRPRGFAHRLENGPLPSWLTPVPMRPGEAIRVYRVSYAGMR